VPAELQDVADLGRDQVLGGELADPADREPVEQDEPAGGPDFEGQRGVVEAAAQLFPLVAAIEPAELAALPLLPDWRATLDATGHLLEIHEPDGVFYDGNLGDGAPAGWHQALRRRGRLVVLVTTAIALDMSDRYDQLTAASRAGRVVGALLPLT
jgi:hypothetical protein